MHSVDLCRAGYRCGASTVTRAGSLTRSSALFSAFNHRRNTGGPILLPRRKHQRTACSYFGCFGGCLWEKKVRTMVPARGALRTKVFTATWPDISTDTSAYDGARTGRRLAENQYSGPRCQVEIRTVQTGSTADALIAGGAPSGWLESEVIIGEDDFDVYGHVDDVVFLNPSLLLRRYNSVSLEGDGKYRLTLSDCHGLVTAPPTATSGVGGEHPKGDEGHTAETARFLFLSIPSSLEFEIGEKAPNGGLEIGTFQLVPVAYIPPTPPPPPPPLQLLVPPSPSLDADHAIGDAETIPAPPPAVLTLPPSTLSTDSVKSTFEGDNRGRAGFSGCFMSGAIVGVVAIVSMTWLMLAKGWGRGKWEGLMNGAGRREGGRKKERTAWVIDAGGGGTGSDDGSSDSDAILRGNVPEPVGLPRSDEDWRTLFDTLYEEEKDQTTAPNTASSVRGTPPDQRALDPSSRNTSPVAYASGFRF